MRIGANTYYTGALEAFATKRDIPVDRVYKLPELGRVEAAAAYEPSFATVPLSTH